MSNKQKEERAPVILFGYDSSPFTNKVRLCLRLKQIPFTYIPVPSMLPRPLLKDTFALTYRKIPVLTIGRELYCDTSLIVEALEHFFPSSSGYGTIYPPHADATLDPWIYRSLARGLTSFWTDRPLFRTTTGLIPASVWNTSFGDDRASLIGHKLDPEKLAKKLPENLANLDLHLGMLEPMLKSGTWVMPTKAPSLADVGWWYQVRWGVDIASGKGVYNLTGGGTGDSGEDATKSVFNAERYPGVWNWFHAFESFVESLPNLETRVDDASSVSLKVMLEKVELLPEDEMLVPAAAEQHVALDEQRGLVKGVMVSVAPDDTGRDFPTLGMLEKIGVEEVVISTIERGSVHVRVHFPRLGFAVRVVEGARL